VVAEDVVTAVMLVSLTLVREVVVEVAVVVLRILLLLTSWRTGEP